MFFAALLVAVVVSWLAYRFMGPEAGYAEALASRAIGASVAALVVALMARFDLRRCLVLTLVGGLSGVLLHYLVSVLAHATGEVQFPGTQDPVGDFVVWLGLLIVSGLLSLPLQAVVIVFVARLLDRRRHEVAATPMVKPDRT